MRRFWSGFWLIVMGASIGCSNQAPPNTTWKFEGPTMGSTYSVTIADPSGAFPEAKMRTLAERINNMLDEINRQMSTYDPASEISQFNQSTSLEPMPVSPMLATVVQSALDVHDRSNGSLDITIAPVIELWGFGTGTERSTPPTDEEIARAQEETGSNLLIVSLDPPTLTKSKATVRVDLNAIVPGYAADRLAEICQEAGYPNCLVDVGGEFVVRGSNGAGQPWRVGIEPPVRSIITTDHPQWVLALTKGGIATSGDYRQFFEHEGKYYSHTIDPKTGRPIQHGLASVTVVAADGISADAYATAVMVMGPKAGLEWIESIPDAEALLLVRKENDRIEEIRSSGFDKLLAEP